MARRRSKKRMEAASKQASVFLPDFPEQVKAIAMRGLTDDEMAAQFGISADLMQDWKAFYPEFSKAIDSGRTNADVRVVQALFHRAIGYSHPEVKTHYDTEDQMFVEHDLIKHYPPDMAAIKMWLTNRQKEHWKGDTTRHEVGGGKDMPDIGVGLRDESKAELVSSILALIQPKSDDAPE